MYPFAVYNDETPVGFMTPDEDLEEKYLVTGRIMFPPGHRKKGYGAQAIHKIIPLAGDCGK